LTEAARLTETLRLGSPERDQPVARATIHQRVASQRSAWWQQRVVVGTVLPAVAVLLLVIGVNRWLADDRCDSCPPLPPRMQITTTSGLPAGWGALLPCPATSAPNRLLAQAAANQPATRARAGHASTVRELGQDSTVQPPGASQATTRWEHPSRVVPDQPEWSPAPSGPACGPGGFAGGQWPALSNEPALGAVWSNPPGS
jgi:hypothetical protein